MPVSMRQPRLMQCWGIWLPSWCCWLQSNCGTCWDWTQSCTWSQPRCSEPGLIFQASWWSWPSCSWPTPLLWAGSHTYHQHAILCEIEQIQKAVINTAINFLLFSLTWCMGGSYTPIGLCWMPHRPWSACSLAFLTTKRFVWDCYKCTTADCDSWPFLSVFLPPHPSGSELQPSAWCFPHRLLHCVHDLCGAEPLHLCHPGGVQSRADTSQGNSPTLSLKCLIVQML